MNEKELNEIEKLKDRAINKAKGAIVTLLQPVPKENLIEGMRKMNDNDLLRLSDEIALEAEAYEICAAAKIVKTERGLE